MADIEEIQNSLSIVRSLPLVSLGFFKKLRIVGGKETDRWDGFGSKVLENPNLQELFPQNVTILHGRMLFHFNPMLCMKTIEEFKKNVVDLRNVEHLPADEVAPNSNGDKIACDVEPLTVNILRISSHVAILLLKPLAYENEHQLLGYTMHYRPAPFKNVTMFEGYNVCGGNAWTVYDIDHDQNYMIKITHTIYPLKPNTQYA